MKYSCPLCTERSTLRYSLNLLTDNTNNNENQSGEGSSTDGTGYTVNKLEHMSVHQNVTFVDGDTAWSYDVENERDSTYQLVGYTDANLAQFLARPIKIQSFTWTPGGTRLFQSFNPWENFFTSSPVNDKIRNFRNLRCDLRLKFVINGNPFYYGRAICAYNPYTKNDDITRNRSFFEQDIVQVSQKPHIMLDPTTSQGGELLCPFIYPFNWVDITITNWYADLGELTIMDFDVLRHANGATEPITVNIFAWTENLQLSVPTSRDVGSLAPQSGKSDTPLDKHGFPKYVNQAKSGPKKKKVKKLDNTSGQDEFKSDGLISKPASAIASIANTFTMVPVLAPYAKATSMVASGIGQLARLFGYSRPQVLEDPRVYVPRYFGNICNTDVPENVVKLSVDSKNELSVDSRVMGLGGQDELTIHSIASRPSYFSQFDWLESDASDNLLASILVCPIYYQTLVSGIATEIHPTSLAFATAPFHCWQGSIKFRFNVVCSEYHRGRLKLVYEPQFHTSIDPMNVNYTSIIDISEDRDFEYEVKWAHPKAWQRVPNMSIWPSVTPMSTSAAIVAGSQYDNGTLSVYVMNELSSPSITAADIKVQVWVSAGDDFAVSVPQWKPFADQSIYIPQSGIYKPQSGVPDVQSSTVDSSNAPFQPDATYSFGSPAKDDNEYLVYQGERIVSFRDLLKRYVYHYSYFPATNGTAANDRQVSVKITDFPWYRGWDPNGPDLAIDSTAGSSRYTFCGQTLINYLTPAFVMRRGSLRHKVQLIYYSNLQNVAMSVTRFAPDLQINTITTDQIGPTAADARKNLNDTALNSFAGSHVTCCRLNPVLEYETPFYTVGERFVPARETDMFGGTRTGHTVLVDVPANTASLDMRLVKYIATGEDFQLGFFVGAPVFYLYSEPTPA